MPSSLSVWVTSMSPPVYYHAVVAALPALCIFLSLGVCLTACNYDQVTSTFLLACRVSWWICWRPLITFLRIPGSPFSPPECPLPQYATWNACVDRCPPGTYPTLKAIPVPGTGRTTLACLRCHYSCKLCHGPSDNECTTCYPDADLVDGGFCQPMALLSKLNAATVWYKAMTVAFMTLCVVIVAVTGLVVVTQTSCLSFCCGRGERRLRDGSGMGARYSGLPVHAGAFSEDGVPPNIPSAPYLTGGRNDQKKKPNVKPYRDEDI